MNVIGSGYQLCLYIFLFCDPSRLSFFLSLSEEDRLLFPVNHYGSNDCMHECSNPKTAPVTDGWRDADQEEDALRRKLKYFFMSPCEKYQAKGRKPFKLVVQILKIIIITVQVFKISLQIIIFTIFISLGCV